MLQSARGGFRAFGAPGFGASGQRYLRVCGLEGCAQGRQARAVPWEPREDLLQARKEPRYMAECKGPPSLMLLLLLPLLLLWLLLLVLVLLLLGSQVPSLGASVEPFDA